MIQAASPPEIFDRARIRRARARAAGEFHNFDFLHRRAMSDIVDRLESVTRGFEHACFYGAGNLIDMLTPDCGVGWITNADFAAERINGARPAAAFDEERISFAPESFDLVVSLLTLHNANDLIGAVSQWRRSLKPDGLFIAAIFGEETLTELRAALYSAETEMTGGVSPRIPPFAGVRDLGAVLQRAGFAMPVADIDSVIVRYGEPLKLLRDLRGMGETGGLASSPKKITRGLLANALQKFSAAGGGSHFDIVYLTGWAPHPDQQKPLKPGSAKHSMAAAVNKRA